uniref:NADH dehydrogenase subunit 3 n=1 Tax=Taeniothrips eucharii TaxID=1818613 RepID=UPI0030E3432A
MVMSVLMFSVTSYMLLSVAKMLSKKSENKKEKLTPFECGYNFFQSARTTFSMKFFLIAIIFIIFDVEIVMILPLILSLKTLKLILWSTSSLTFMLILILGVMVEWKEKTFNWKN